MSSDMCQEGERMSILSVDPPSSIQSGQMVDGTLCFLAVYISLLFTVNSSYGVFCYDCLQSCNLQSSMTRSP